MAVEWIGAAALLAEARAAFYRLDTVADHWLVAHLEGGGIQLLYRPHPYDTTWTRLAVDPAETKFSRNDTEVRLQTADLDGQGQPEVLLTLHATDYASGGDQYWDHAYLLDVTPRRPRLLLRAFTGDYSRASIAYAARHGDTLTGAEAYAGCIRRVELNGRELVVDPVRQVGAEYSVRQGGAQSCQAGSTLTPLPAGRYRYQHGALVRVVR
ncbi:hypothetical protein DLM85_03360 [Hymenobacter edaphi]|uniref:Uncharacterized protein n=2 Tax=Hymenobacter edaphi TaxID=2211146 RepID=A0A328BV44_9BACT|nr:hypothetical protein DLM85_03360 [Hymenobacter edaphi]